MYIEFAIYLPSWLAGWTDRHLGNGIDQHFAKIDSGYCVFVLGREIKIHKHIKKRMFLLSMNDRLAGFLRYLVFLLYFIQ